MSKCDHKWVCIGTHWIPNQDIPDRTAERIDISMCALCFDKRSELVKWSIEEQAWLVKNKWDIDNAIKLDREDWDSEVNGLLPCPYCGGKAIESDDNEMELTIECGKCVVSMYCNKDWYPDYVTECRKKWNKRVAY